MDGDGLAQQCLTNPRAARLRIKGERCERDLLYFVRSFWSILEPAKSNAFVDGWVLGAIADHLMAVTDGQIRRLLINVPPGFTKSLMTDVFWPAWEWGPCDRPAERYIAASYAAHLTTRDNRRFLALAQCPEYREIWGGRFEIIRDGEGLISNDKTGWKIATSVGGVGTGERGSRIIIDDPNNPIDVESDLVRN
ncbi:MAG TPA: hypothetical protein VMU93_16800, partial [Caulobacteraceae bacterium]|nr:hypothetical protein [Caulobacteraceae bacterium]